MKTQTNKSFNNVRLKVFERLYEFKDSESLTQYISLLYKKPDLRRLESSLYQTTDSYKLIIKSVKNCNSYVLSKEFCYKSSNSNVEISKTEEYAKNLIENNAVEIYGKAFNPKT